MSRRRIRLLCWDSSRYGLTAPYMRSRTRKLIVLLVVLLVIAAIGFAIYLRKRAAPEPARLLPDSDVVFYANLRNVRRLISFGDKPVKQDEPEYQEFVRETGFQFERDLEEAAFAVHRVVILPKKKGEAPTTEARYSEVLVGKFDSQKLTAYLHKISKAEERYRETEIFAIPIEDRTVRVAILSVDSVAASNVDDPKVIHGIVDRARAAAMPFQGPAVLSDNYRKVPIGSLVWAIARVPALTGTIGEMQVGSLSLPGGIDIQVVPPRSTVVASARYLGSIHARADVYTPTDADAKKLAEQASTVLNLFRSAEVNSQNGATDPDIKAAFDSLKTEQEGARATLSATIPVGFFKKFLSEPPDVTGSEESQAKPTAPAEPAKQQTNKLPAKKKK